MVAVTARRDHRARRSAAALSVPEVHSVDLASTGGRAGGHAGRAARRTRAAPPGGPRTAAWLPRWRRRPAAAIY